MTERTTTGRSVTLAQDSRRQRAFQRARWNTRYVRTLRFLLPLAAVGLVGIYGLNLTSNMVLTQLADDANGKISFESAEISPEGFGMANPRYEGFNSDGSRFVVTAQRAITGLKADGPVRLESIDGKLFGLADSVTRLIATRGTYDQKGDNLTLRDGILIESTDGMVARLVSARVEPKTGAIQSDEPVEVQLPTATVSGRQFRANQKTRVVLFDRGVVAHLKPEQISSDASQPNGQPQPSPAGGFQVNSNEPIRVTAKSLEVRDNDNQAVFATNVLAVQAQGELAANKLTIRYTAEPAKKTGTRAAPSAGNTSGAVGGNRKVEQLIAEQNVRLTQGTDTILAARAVFAPEANTADFSGGVRVTSAETRAEAQTMFVDQAKSTARLIGGVRIAQGQNTLSGDQLTVDQTTGRLILTATRRGASIATRFFRDVAPGATPQSTRPPPQVGRQSPFSFETDANAPIDVTAQKLDVRDQRKQAVYSGGVTAKQGVFSIQAATLTANYTGSAGLASIAPGAPQSQGASQGADLQRLIADGDVTITSSPTQKAKGDRAVYDIPNEKLTLAGNVTVIDGRQILSGERLTIDMTTGQSSLTSAAKNQSVAEGEKKSGRMRAILFPVDLQNARKQRQGKSGATPNPDAGGWSAQTSSGQPRTN